MVNAYYKMNLALEFKFLALRLGILNTSFNDLHQNPDNGFHLNLKAIYFLLYLYYAYEYINILLLTI